MNTNRYVIKSLELHLFFGRIMKEHAFFLEAGFTPANPAFSEKAEFFRREFEVLLRETVTLAGGIVGREVIESGEAVTEFTAWAEKQSACFTGISIDKDITSRTLCLQPGERRCDRNLMPGQVRRLNRTALKLLSEMRSYKVTIPKGV